MWYNFRRGDGKHIHVILYVCVYKCGPFTRVFDISACVASARSFFDLDDLQNETSHSRLDRFFPRPLRVQYNIYHCNTA